MKAEEGTPWIAPAPPVRRTGRVFRWLVVSLVVVSCLGYAFRMVGFLRFERGVARLEARIPRPLERRQAVEPSENAALPFEDLEALVKQGKADFEPELDSERNARRALAQILTEAEPTPEAWALVEAWLPKLDEAFLVIERICERPRWCFDEGDGSWGARLVPVLRVRLLERVVPWVSVAAVRAARAGDASLALRRLRQSFQLSAAQADAPSASAFFGFVQRMSYAFEGLEQVLRVLPPDQDLAWFAAEIAGLDARAMRARALAGDLYGNLELYRRGDLSELLVRSLSAQLTGGPSASRWPEFPHRVRELWFYPLIAGHDAARFVERSEEMLGLLDGSLADAARLVEAKRWGPAPWRAPTADFVASTLSQSFAPCIELESHVRLARIAFADREQGRAAALALLERTVDPGDDQPVGRRDEADGSLTLWCVGPDLIDMEGVPGEEDVVWRLPPRR